MQVLFLTHSFPRQAGDAPGSFILRLARALRAHDIEATILVPHAPGLATSAVLEDIAVRRFRYAPARYETLAYVGTMAEQVRASWSARIALGAFLGAELASGAQVVRQLRPALLHAHWWFPSGIVANWLGRMFQLPTVTTLHGSDVRFARATRPARLAFQRVLSGSTAVTAVSNWLATQAHAIADGSSAPLVAPMPVAAELFSPGGERATDRLLFVGRLNRQKGLAFLLGALAQMRARPTLDVVGGGEDAAALRSMACSLQLDARVRWYGTQPQSQLAAFYRSATAVVVPSVEEGLGLVAVEAQLCETPVVAFDSGGLADVVQQNRTGILVRERDAAALAVALDGLLAHPEHAAALGRTGRVHALATFAPARVAERYAGIYAGALDRYRRS